MTQLKLIKRVEEIFTLKLQMKTSWGKNEALIELKDSINEACLELIDKRRPFIVANDSKHIGKDFPSDKPEWLTPFLERLIRKLWVNNNRVLAIITLTEAAISHNCVITNKESENIIQKYCL